MPGHVQVHTASNVNSGFEIIEASWIDSAVELHLRPTGPAPSLEGLRLRFDAAAVTEVFSAVMRYAADAELGVIE
jgi:hypothetical protein